MEGLVAEFGLRVVCKVATFGYHLLQAVAVESLLVLGVMSGVGSALLFRHVSRWGQRVTEFGGIALCVFFIFVAPLLAPLEPFPVQPYAASHFAFDSATGFPSMPPLLLPNETLTTDGPWFKDSGGRVLVLHGVNVGGGTKLPSSPDGATWKNESRGFWTDRGNVTFVDRPFPLEEADEHFGRLASWGLTFVRLLVTWEAVEHSGPGLYDEQYLDYLVQLVRKAAKHNVFVFMDPHQDVWSRWTGGDGAPFWTLEAAGFNLDNLDKTGAALTHQGHGDPLPPMIWGTNNWRLACATMFTLFFAGDTFAPATNAFGVPPSQGGVPIQQFLQAHYIDAMAKVAGALASERNVVGFDTLNEPNAGWIGRKDLASRSDGLAFRWGLNLSPFELMTIGAGFGGVEADTYSPPFVHHSTGVVNSGNLSAWTHPEVDIVVTVDSQASKEEKGGGGVGWGGCVWRANGVWDVDKRTGKPTLLRPKHFELDSGKQWIDEFMVPFWSKFERAVKAAASPARPASCVNLRVPPPPNPPATSSNPQALLMFAEPPIDFSDPTHHHVPTLGGSEAEDKRLVGWVYAPHWYDVVVLIAKTYSSWLGLTAWTHPLWLLLSDGKTDVTGPVIGREAMVSGHTATLAALRKTAAKMDGGYGVPTLLGETGIAMDLLHKAAFVTRKSAHSLLPLLHAGRQKLKTLTKKTKLDAATAKNDAVAAAAAEVVLATTSPNSNQPQLELQPQPLPASFDPSDPWFGLDPLSFGDWTLHVYAMDNILRALDANLMSFTLWNYTPQNSNARGDGWNDEDLSLWSCDQLDHVSDHGSDGEERRGQQKTKSLGRHLHDPYAGGRALPAVVRPYARKVSGIPKSMAFDMHNRVFKLSFTTPPTPPPTTATTASAASVSPPSPSHAGLPTEVFCPLYQYPAGVEVEVSDGHYEHHKEQQVVYYWADPGVNRLHTLTLRDPRTNDAAAKRGRPLPSL